VIRARNASILLVLIATILGSACAASPAGTGGPVDRVVLVVEDGASLEGLLSSPIFADLARGGGVALMTTYGAMPSLGRALDQAGIQVCAAPGAGVPGRLDDGPLPGCPGGAKPGRRLIVVGAGGTPGDPFRDAMAVRGAILDASEGSAAALGVLVVSPSPSLDMDRRGDQVPPLIEAVGPPELLFDSSGRMRTLTSDTTRRDGLVANIDVGPTILTLFGEPIPTTMTGSPIRVVDAPAPLDLHRRYLEYRRIRAPLDAALIAFVSVMFVVSVVTLALLWRGAAFPSWASGTLRFLLLFGVALPIVLMAGGLLSRFTHAVVWPLVIMGPAALAGFSLLFRRDPMAPFTFLGAVGLALLAVNAMLLGGRAFEIPLLGGTVFDGVRFYGLPNAFIALVLASSLFVAVRLGLVRGFLLLLAAGLFVGAPGLGADLGGSVTLFAAAGLWWPLRRRAGFGWREGAMTVGTVVAGTALVLLMNRFLADTPTHLTRFVEGAGLSPGRVFGRFFDRLGIGFGQVADVPSVSIALVGLVALLWLAVSNAGPVGRGLAFVGGPWREVLIAMTAAGLVAFVANDTGVAAAAPVFLYAVGVATYSPLVGADVARPSVPGSVRA
jgi:hypothetical protein